jgi:hypothetical protein
MTAAARTTAWRSGRMSEFGNRILETGLSVVYPSNDSFICTGSFTLPLFSGYK